MSSQTLLAGEFASRTIAYAWNTDTLQYEAATLNNDGLLVSIPGGATGAKQDTANSSLASIDGKTPTLVSGRMPTVLYYWNVDTLAYQVATVPTAGAGGGGDASAANQTTEIARLTSILAQLDVALSTRASTAKQDSLLTELQLKADLTETQPVSLATIPINAASATAAKQDTGNSSVASIDGKTPALGQALAASAVPVVLTAIQQAALTPPAAIAGFALEAGHLAAIDTSTAKIPALGQAAAAASVPVVLPAAQITTLTPPAAITGYALEAGHLAAIDTSTAKIPSVGQKAMVGSMPVVLASDQASVPVAATLAAETTKVIGTVNVAAGQTIGVTGPLTDTQLRATAVPVSGVVSSKTDLSPSAPTAATVGVASASAVGANAARKGLVLVNTSNNRVSLGFGQTAVLDSGITLYGPGGTFEMDEYTFDVGTVNAIASAASSNLAVQEYA